jgi:Short-chain alcohol dehydrogenase of unknown specificity
MKIPLTKSYSNFVYLNKYEGQEVNKKNAMENITGKVVVITGGSSGIGEATARRLAAEGAIVALAARRKDKLDQIAADIAMKGGKAMIYQVDVTNKSQVSAMVADVAANRGRLDVFVANAGLMANSLLSEGKTDEWDAMIDVNLKGVLYGVAAVWPIFTKQGSGHFISISSVAGLKVAAPGNSVYSATKFAVKALAEGIRVESAGKFRSTVLYPGYVESELKYGSSNEKVRNAVVEAYKQNEIPADAVANAILYAMSQPDNTGINEITIRPTVQEF